VPDPDQHLKETLAGMDAGLAARACPDAGRTHTTTANQQHVLDEARRTEQEIAAIRVLIDGDQDGKTHGIRHTDLLWAKRRILTQYLGLLEQEASLYSEAYHEPLP
jgi:hypothetical protein